MTTTPWCSGPRKHAAFGYHQRGPEGLYCTACRVLPAPSSVPTSGVPEGDEVNMPSPTTPPVPDPVPDTITADTSHEDPMGAAPVPAPSRPPAPVGRKRRCPYIYCGREFPQRRRDQVWCSPNCRKNYYSRNRYARDRAEAGESYTPQFPIRDRAAFRALLEDDEEGGDEM